MSSGRNAGTLTTVSALDKFLDIGVNCICVNIGPFLNEGVISTAKKFTQNEKLYPIHINFIINNFL